MPNQTQIAVAQMTSTDDIDRNFQTCRSLIQQAKAQDCHLLAFPENFAFLGASPSQPVEILRYQDLAKEHDIWLSLGGIQEPSPVSGKTFNTHYIVDNHGKIRAKYQKIHLFTFVPSSGAPIDESTVSAAGQEIVTADSPFGKLGLSICYDLRFPELFSSLISDGAQILLIPAAFNDETGKAHWEVLLRARAIETQSYVAAAAQTGVHSKDRSSHGHAMIVDPWGTIIAQCSEGTGIAVANVKLSYLNSIRNRLPIHNHRRPDIYVRSKQ